MRNFDLSPLYRSAIGFDRLFNHLENNQSQSNGGYPPYNVELVDENHYRIAIAVAGFAESELEITAQDNLLVVKGAHADEQKERTYLYQGIAERKPSFRNLCPDFGKCPDQAGSVKAKNLRVGDRLATVYSGCEFNDVRVATSCRCRRRRSSPVRRRAPGPPPSCRRPR